MASPPGAALDRAETTLAATAHAPATLGSLKSIKKPSKPYEYP